MHPPQATHSAAACVLLLLLCRCCPHSAWFADGIFDRLGLPSSWLHPLYQAVLAPVRLLWQYMPRTVYLQQYQVLVQESDLHEHPTLANLASVILSAVQGWVAGGTVDVVAAASVRMGSCLLSSVTIGATAALLHLSRGNNKGRF